MLMLLMLITIHVIQESMEMIILPLLFLSFGTNWQSFNEGNGHRKLKFLVVFFLFK